MDANEDRHGLDRSVMAYRDVATQPAAQFYLIIDEGMGQKALFSVDGVHAEEFVVQGWRTRPGGGADTVIQFGPHLPWRLVNASEVYLQDSRTVYEREAQERKEMQVLETEFRKMIKPIEHEDDDRRVPGQYV